MRRTMSMVAIVSLALVGCGGDDSDSGGDGGDSAGGADSSFCRTALDLADEYEGFEENITDDNFYDDIGELYRKLGDAASGDLSDDFDRVIDGFEKIAEWSEDPSSDYPFSDAEDAELEASMERIDAASAACGIDVGDDSVDVSDDSADVSDDSGDDASIDDDEGTVTFGDGDESGEMSLGGDLPDEFPFPVPDDYEVGSSFEFGSPTGTTFSVLLNAPESDFDDVASLYEDFLNDEGFEVTKSDFSSDGSRYVSITGSRTDTEAFVTISTEEVANDAAGNLTFETVISLTWTPVG